MAKSTRSNRSRKISKPKKPYSDFPLSPHARGQWQKKINGKIHYFGRWGNLVNGEMVRILGDGWQDALAIYKAQADDLHAGKTPKAKLVNGKIEKEPESSELRVKDLCNRFLTSKHRQLEESGISNLTFKEYKATCERIARVLGKDRLVYDLSPDDFATLRSDIAKSWGPVRLGNEVQRVRTVFKYGYDNHLIDRPVRFGSEFKKPSRRILRKHKANSGKRMVFDENEIQVMLIHASTNLRAMILLGINCGFGNHDCGSLPISAIDLDNGWIHYPRPKTGIDRRCPLWEETVLALQAVIEKRPSILLNESNPVFLTKYANPWSSDAVSGEFAKLLKNHSLHRAGVGFYALRHTFRTIADSTRDFPAIRLVMGHADDSIDDVYREHIDNERLVAVTNHVRDWLFPPEKIAKDAGASERGNS